MRAFRADASGQLSTDLEPALEKYEERLLDIIQPLELLTITDLDVDSSTLKDDARSVLLASSRYWQRTASALNLALHERIKTQQIRQFQLALVVLIPLALALYLFIGFYRSIRRTVDSLRQASRRMVEGEQSSFAELHTADEMAMVVRSFNSVADALRKAESNYRGIVENALGGIFQTSLAGEFLMANPAFASILGYDSASNLMECASNIADQIYANPDRRREFPERIEQDGSVVDFQSEAIRKSGETIWISESTRSIRDASGQIVALAGTLIDISRRKRDAAEIERLNNQLKDDNLRMGAELSITRKLQDMLMLSEHELGSVVVLRSQASWSLLLKSVVTITTSNRLAIVCG